MIKQLNKYRTEGRLKRSGEKKNWSNESTRRRRRRRFIAYYCHCVSVSVFFFVIYILTIWFIFTSQFRHKNVYKRMCICVEAQRS